MDLDTHELGLDIAERYRLSVYDGMIFGAALRAGCRLLYSEDLQHGQQIEASRFGTPSASQPLDARHDGIMK